MQSRNGMDYLSLRCESDSEGKEEEQEEEGAEAACDVAV